MLPQLYLIFRWPWSDLGDYETLPVHVYMHVCVCHIFKLSFISCLDMKISSPNMQRMFMAVKTCLLKIMVLILKKPHGCHSQLLESHWSKI